MSNGAILPGSLAYTREFTSRLSFGRRELSGADAEYAPPERIFSAWSPVPHMSDLALHAQVQEFVDSTGAQLISISPPSVTSLIDTPTRREYYISMAVMFVPAEEGTEDDAPSQ